MTLIHLHPNFKELICKFCKWPVSVQTPFKWCNHVHYPEAITKTYYYQHDDWISFEDFKGEADEDGK